MTQMLTSAQQTTEVVALMPIAATLWAAAPVLADQDLPEMESTAMVNSTKTFQTQITISWPTICLCLYYLLFVCLNFIRLLNQLYIFAKSVEV